VDNSIPLLRRNGRVYLPIGGASLQAMSFGPIVLDVDDRCVGVMRLAKQGEVFRVPAEPQK